eukprot:11976731-Heterocapsa_arctica.AAC.1
MNSVNSLLLKDEKITEYRGHAMRISYIAQDRPDLSYASNSLSRVMKSPRESDWENLKRVGRYVRGAPVGRILFRSQSIPKVVEAFCDSDHAGDPTSRKSRSGMALMWGTHLLKHGSA